MSNPPNPDSSPAPDPEVPVDPWLDPLLRETLDTYVHDEGFSARVVANLPAPRRRREWLRPVLLGAGAIVGLVVGSISAIQGTITSPQAADLLHRAVDLAGRTALNSTLTIGQLGMLTICLGLIAGSIRRGLRLAHSG